LPEEKSYLFRGRVPKTSSVAELRTSVEFIIEENVPLSVSEAVFDYFVIEDPSLETNDTLDVAVSVVPRDLVESYVSILNSAGLSPLHFEIESQAIAKAVVKKGDKTPYLLINLFDRKIGIYVVSQEAIQFASTLPLTERPERKGEKIESEGEKQMTSKTSPIDIDIPIEEVKSETNKIISYWNSQSERLGSDKIPIETAVLSGKGADSKKLSRDLSFLNMKIRAADVWTNAFSLEDYIPSLPKNESLEYVVAVGLAIPNRPRS
jgi:Tfp pilus assembly PilM family ATPase